MNFNRITTNRTRRTRPVSKVYIVESLVSGGNHHFPLFFSSPLKSPLSVLAAGGDEQQEAFGGGGERHLRPTTQASEAAASRRDDGWRRRHLPRRRTSLLRRGVSDPPWLERERFSLLPSLQVATPSPLTLSLHQRHQFSTPLPPSLPLSILKP